jgi:hypothetical protein
MPTKTITFPERITLPWIVRFLSEEDTTEEDVDRLMNELENRGWHRWRENFRLLALALHKSKRS